MTDLKGLILEIVKIIGIEGTIEKNTIHQSVGTFTRKNGYIQFPLDYKYSICFPSNRINDRDAQFITLLLAKTITNEDPDSILAQILSGKSISKQELISSGFTPDELYLPIILKTMKADQWKDLFYSYFTKKAPIAFQDGFYHILVPIGELGMEEFSCTDLEELGHGYVNLLLEEGIDTCCISLAKPIQTHMEWKDGLDQAKNTILVGRIFYPDTPIFFSWKLTIESMLASLTFLEANKYLEKTLDIKAHGEIDPELLKIVSVLLEVNFNLSETARRLFIHRNTLLYRIERVREQTGKDLRMAKDTIEIYIALLLRNKVAQK